MKFKFDNRRFVGFCLGAAAALAAGTVLASGFKRRVPSARAWLRRYATGFELDSNLRSTRVGLGDYLGGKSLR